MRLIDTNYYHYYPERQISTLPADYISDLESRSIEEWESFLDQTEGFDWTAFHGVRRALGATPMFQVTRETEPPFEEISPRPLELNAGFAFYLFMRKMRGETALDALKKANRMGKVLVELMKTASSYLVPTNELVTKATSKSIN